MSCATSRRRKFDLLPRLVGDVKGGDGFGAECHIRRGVAELAKQVATAVTPSASSC